MVGRKGWSVHNKLQVEEVGESMLESGEGMEGKAILYRVQ